MNKNKYRYNIDKDNSHIRLSVPHIIIITIGVIVLCAALIICAYQILLKQALNEATESARAEAAAGASQAEEVDISKALRKRTVKRVIENNEIPAYSFAEVCSMDMSVPSGVSVEDLKLVTRLGLVGLEDTLYQIEQDYDINCLFLLGIASHESAYGTMQFHPNNLCGYGYSGFSSKAECLNTVGRALANNYLSPSGPFYKGKTIDSVNKTYAADPAWDSKVARKVTYFYQIISENHNKQLEKLK